MDDPVPTVDFSPSGDMDFVYSFERSDVEGKLRSPFRSLVVGSCLAGAASSSNFSAFFFSTSSELEHYVDDYFLSSYPALLQLLDDLKKYAESTKNDVSFHAVCECRAALEKLISKMDNLELGFDKIAERSRGCPDSSNERGQCDTHMDLNSERLSSAFALAYLAVPKTV